MATCPGKKGSSTCYSSVYKCGKCGSVGCSVKGCTNQNFESIKCLRCGQYDRKSV